MNKNLIYLAILSLVLSHTVLERLIGLFVTDNKELFGDISTVLFLVCVLLVPILLAYLVGLWKLELKRSILVYGAVILLAVIVKSVWMLTAFGPEFTLFEALFNVMAHTVVPLILFWGSYKIFEKFLNRK